MATGVGDFFRKLLPQDSAFPTQPTSTSSAKPLSIAEIKAEAEGLAHMLKSFSSGWGYMPELQWFQLLIGSTPRALDLLAIELNAFARPPVSSSYAYSKPAPAKGDAGWLDKLEKAQEGIARAPVAAALFRELFPRAKNLESSCRQMLKTKGLPNSLDYALRLSVESLKSLVSFKPIEDRLQQRDAEHTKMAEMTNLLEVHRYDQQLAEIAVQITAVRKVLEAIKE